MAMLFHWFNLTVLVAMFDLKSFITKHKLEIVLFAWVYRCAWEQFVG